MDRKNDLTQGNIAKQILVFSIPIFLGYLFQNLYNSVDSMVVGKYVGKTALAAVTSCASISNILVGFFTGLSTGSMILFSRYFGAKNYKGLHDAIHTSTLFSIISGIGMAIVGIFIAPWLLNLVACPADVFPEALLYLRIYLAGCLFTSIYNILSGILRSVGDSRSPFNYLVVSSVTNVILDFLFVKYLQLGVAGVGMATIISQGTSVALSLKRLTSTDDVYKLELNKLKIDKDILGELINLGIPTAIQSSLISFSNIFVQKYVNSFDSTVMAGIGAAQKIDQFVSMPGMSIGLAISTYVSQNLGANKKDRVHKGVNTSLMITLISTAVIAVPVFMMANTLVQLFNTDPEVVKYGVGMMRTIIPFYVLINLNALYGGVVRGYGYTKEVMVISLVGMVGARQLFLAITFGIAHVVENIYYAWPVGWFCATVLNVLFYIFVIIRKEKMEESAS